MADKFEKGNLVSKMCNITYRLGTDYSVLLEKYRLNEIAGEGTDYDRARRLLSWEAEHSKLQFVCSFFILSIPIYYALKPTFDVSVRR